MNTPVTKARVAEMSPIILLQHVFGRKEGQTTAEFLKEVGSLKQDEAFVAECRTWASALATE